MPEAELVIVMAWDTWEVRAVFDRGFSGERFTRIAMGAVNDDEDKAWELAKAAREAYRAQSREGE